MDETQNDAPFVAFYDMHAVTFVPPATTLRRSLFKSFSPFPVIFSTLSKPNFQFSVKFILLSAKASIWATPKLCCLLKSVNRKAQTDIYGRQTVVAR